MEMNAGWPSKMAASVILFAAEMVRILMAFTHPVLDPVLDCIYSFLMGPERLLPPIDDKLLLMPATELAEKIRKRQLRCEDVMHSYIKRSKQIHPAINAVVDSRYEDALEEAREMDRSIEAGERSEDEMARDTPLLGVPFSCKEVLGVKGLAQTSGMLRARDHTADTDCHAAAELRKAGAIPVTVTNVPETCMWWETANLLFSITFNPFDRRRTVGGSTGGEAALITSAGAVMGIGSDIGGSIRIPAAFCSIYGHKPSRGIVSNWGTYPYCHMTPDRKDVRPVVKFVSTGPMCRYAKDLPVLLKVMSAYDPRLQMDVKVDFSKVKVYYMKGIPGIVNAARTDVRKAIIKAAKFFEDEYGVKSTCVRFKEFQYSTFIYLSKFLEIGAPPFSTVLAGKDGSISLWWELLKCVFRRSEHTLPVIYFALVNQPSKDACYRLMLDKYNELERKFNKMFEEDAIFLFPTHPEPPPHYLMTIPKLRNIGYTSMFNLLGFPCTSVPAGLSNGLPIGIQVVSGQMKDHLTIAAAIQLDKIFNGWNSPCPITV